MKIINTLLVSTFLLCLSTTVCKATTITIDPGHSYSKPGAMSCSGIGEVYFNDALASYVAAALQKAGHTVRLTRMGKGSPSLLQRAADSKTSSLLLSLHHDSVQPQFLDRYVGQDGKERLCTRHARGYSIFISRKNAKIKESETIAIRIARSLQRAGFSPSHHHSENIPGEGREMMDSSLGIYYFDDLVVLKKAGVPAILVEAGVIVNNEDELISAKPETMAMFSAAVVDSLTQ